MSAVRCEFAIEQDHMSVVIVRIIDVSDGSVPTGFKHRVLAFAV